MSYLDTCTEGEWYADIRAKGGLVLTDGSVVCDVYDKNDITLIAASKDMYAALDEVNSILSTLMENSNIRMLVPDDGIYDEAIEKANLALKAARGEK